MPTLFNKRRFFFNKSALSASKSCIFARMETAQTGLVNYLTQFTIQILPYLFLLLLHHFLLAPLFFRRKLIFYIPVTLVLLVGFGFYCFNVGNPIMPPQGPQGMFQGPPPMAQEGSVPPPMPMSVPPANGTPPFDTLNRPAAAEMRPAEGMPPQIMPDRGHRPMRPETMKLLMALLLIGVDLGAMAYVKNIRTEKQIRALKAENQKNQATIEELNHSAANARKAESELVFKTDYKQVRVKPDNILYIEGMGEYLKIFQHGAATPLVVLMSMKRILEQLPDDRFARVHKSYIVNLNRITASSRTQITLESGAVVPIGESYRVAVSERLKFS